MVICLERGADLHMFQLMPLPLTVFCFSKIQIGFAFLVPAHLGSPRKRAIKWVYVCHINLMMTIITVFSLASVRQQYSKKKSTIYVICTPLLMTFTQMSIR